MYSRECIKAFFRYLFDTSDPVKGWGFEVTGDSASQSPVPAYSIPSGRLVISQRVSRHKWKFAVTKHPLP